MSGDFVSGGAGDKDRSINLRDNSKSKDGIPEDKERGGFKQSVLAFVDKADDDGLITDTTQVIFQPRNWHLSKGDVINPGLPSVKDNRADVALIADHEHDYPGWKIDDDEKSPYLDDWFLSGSTIQKSTRIVDYKDPKGRTGLLSQLVKVTDDALQQYTVALKLRRQTGGHDVAASGYVWDEEHDFNGLLDTFWTTHPGEDKLGTGREGTEYGILSMRHDAHIDKKENHGRIKFDDIDLSGVPDGALKYKCSMGFDPSVKNSDTENAHETGQWRPWYHCIDEPEKPREPGIPGRPGEPHIPPPPDKPRQPGQPERPEEPGGGPNDEGGFGKTLTPDEIKKFIETGGGLPVETGTGDGPTNKPPSSGKPGRVVCLDFAHDPPLDDGLHDDCGHFALSETGPWWGSVADGWRKIVDIPKGTPKGKTVTTDGDGGVEWVDPPVLPPTEVFTKAPVLTPPPGTPDNYVPTSNSNVENGFEWGPAPTGPMGPEGATGADGAGPSLPKGYISGFDLKYDGAFPSIVHVGGGLCRDSTNTYDVVIDDPDADYLTNGGPLFNDALLSANGDCPTATIGGGNWSGDGHFDNAQFDDGTTTWTSKFNGRTLTGTMAVAARSVGTILQKITGTGSLFLSELAIGDVIGNSTCGHGAVAQIDTDTQCWVIKEFSDLSSATYSTQTFTCYENPQVQVGAGPSCRVSEVSKNGKVIYTRGQSFDGGSGSITAGKAVVIGQPAPPDKWSGTGGLPGVYFPSWIFLWARRKSDGTATVSWSTQRKRPFTPSTLTGYSIWRRIAVLPIRADNFAPPFDMVDMGRLRYYRYQEDLSDSSRVLIDVLNNSALNSGWNRLPVHVAVPNGVRRFKANLIIANPSVDATFWARAANLGSAGVASPTFVKVSNAAKFGTAEFELATDGDAIDVAATIAAGAVFSVYVTGYYDTLGDIDAAAGTGGAFSPRYSNVAAVADYSVLPNQSGNTTFTNTGAGIGITFFLPPWEEGLDFVFQVDAAHALTVQADGTDTISVGGSTSSAGGTASSSALRDSLRIRASAPGEWIAEAATGTWPTT